MLISNEQLQTRNTFNKLWSLADNYMHIKSRLNNVKNMKIKKHRNLEHLNEEVRKVPVPLSFTLDNLIIDQKIGRLI